MPLCPVVSRVTVFTIVDSVVVVEEIEHDVTEGVRALTGVSEVLLSQGVVVGGPIGETQGTPP